MFWSILALFLSYLFFSLRFNLEYLQVHDVPSPRPPETSNSGRQMKLKSSEPLYPITQLGMIAVIPSWCCVRYSVCLFSFISCLEIELQPWHRSGFGVTDSNSCGVRVYLALAFSIWFCSTSLFLCLRSFCCALKNCLLSLRC